LYQFTESICSVIYNSYRRCLVTSTTIKPAFRSYMPNKYSLLTIAKESGYADELLKYYLEKEPDMLEYMIRNICGPEHKKKKYDRSYYELLPIPDITTDPEWPQVSYSTIQEATRKIPSIAKMQQFVRQGKLKSNLDQINELVCIILLRVFYLLMIFYQIHTVLQWLVLTNGIYIQETTSKQDKVVMKKSKTTKQYLFFSSPLKKEREYISKFTLRSRFK
jgi:hypothetical protein